MKSIEIRYNQVLNEATQSGLLLWTNDPRYAVWITYLLDAAGTSPVRVSALNDISALLDQQATPTVFSVGAYLHKELLPLSCAAMAEPKTAAAYASYAREIEVSVLHNDSFLSKDSFERWHKSSAIIADLAVIPKDLEQRGWTLLRLPHCVYVPIGIGFSVATVPLLSRNWRNNFLAEAGEILYPSTDALAKIGIELDARMWTAGRGNGG